MIYYTYNNCYGLDEIEILCSRDALNLATVTYRFLACSPRFRQTDVSGA